MSTSTTDPAKTDPPAGDPPKDPAKTDPPKDPAAKTDPPAGDPPKDPALGPAGEKALAAERDARKALEKELAALAPLKKLAESLGTSGDPQGGDNKSDIEQLTERMTNHEAELAKERAGRLRAEVAHSKGLTPQQAGRLQGSTKEELEADADALIEDFGVQPGKPGTPKPDRTQGNRGAASDLDARIAQAEKDGDIGESLRLKNAKLLAAQK